MVTEPDPRCGTDAGAQRHRGAGEPVCEPCREAAREYQRARRAALRAAGPPPWQPRPWMDQAACRGTFDEAFYATEPQSATPAQRRATANLQEQAKRVCRRCPVRAECLAYAIANDERYGVWGGKTEVERNGVRGA